MAKAADKSKSKSAGRMTTRAKAPAKQRAVRAAPAKPRAASAKKPQRFTVAHARDGEFKTDGLRPYALYRDLGIAAASGGLCQAHVIRLIGPCTDEVRKRHYHDTELQLIYVLKGWMKNEFEGHGEPAHAGFSHRASSTRCSTTRTTARCWRSSCPRTSKRSS